MDGVKSNQGAVCIFSAVAEQLKGPEPTAVAEPWVGATVSGMDGEMTPKRKFLCCFQSIPCLLYTSDAADDRYVV